MIGLARSGGEHLTLAPRVLTPTPYLMTRTRMAALVIAGFLLVAGAAELQAQGRDTSSTRAQAFPKPLKAKAQPTDTASQVRARDGNVAGKGMLPPKTKSAPTPQRVDSLPPITKPPKAPRPPA
jgi:hypothetical protein